jgi:hypothetical protein
VVVVNEASARAFSPDKHNPAAILGQEMIPTTRDRDNGSGIALDFETGQSGAGELDDHHHG